MHLVALRFRDELADLLQPIGVEPALAASALHGKAIGRLLVWPAELVWRSSPMTYSFDGKQYVALAAGSNVVSFGLVP